MLRNAKALHQVLHDIRLPNYQKEQLVSKRLKSVLISSYKHVPYYRKMMQNLGYDPVYDYKGPQDLKMFPVTTKLDLKTHGPSSFLKENTDTANLYILSTSGSTGIPIKIYLDMNEKAFRIAKWLRVLFMNGYSVRDKILSTTPPTRLNDGITFLQKFGILRRLAINYMLPAKQIADAILSYEPQIIYANRSHLDSVALELLKREIKPKGLKLIIAGAEIIHESSRDLCKKAFGLDITEYYGSNEMGVMAFEITGRNGLHLCDDLTFFEFLDKNGNPVLPGEPGRIIVTDLIGKTMPFIRYDQEDFAVTDNIINSKGLPEKIISKILGRDDDQVTLPDGSTKTFHEFYIIMNKYTGVTQFRVIQKTKSYFQIKVVTDNNYFKEIYNQIMDSLYLRFPKSCRFNILRVGSLEPDLTGKLRMFISELKDCSK